MVYRLYIRQYQVHNVLLYIHLGKSTVPVLCICRCFDMAAYKLLHAFIQISQRKKNKRKIWGKKINIDYKQGALGGYIQPAYVLYIR